MKPRAPHVAVDDNHLGARLSENHRSIHYRRRLPLARLTRGYQQGLGRSSGR